MEIKSQSPSPTITNIHKIQETDKTKTTTKWWSISTNLSIDIYFNHFSIRYKPLENVSPFLTLIISSKTNVLQYKKVRKIWQYFDSFSTSKNRTGIGSINKIELSFCIHICKVKILNENLYFLFHDSTENHILRYFYSWYTTWLIRNKMGDNSSQKTL